MLARSRFFLGFVTGAFAMFIICTIVWDQGLQVTTLPPPHRHMGVNVHHQIHDSEDDGDDNDDDHERHPVPPSEEKQVKGAPSMNVSEIAGRMFGHNHTHTGEDSQLAVYLHKKVRVLCWIMTSPSNIESKAVHVYKTWASKCNVVLFMSSAASDSYPFPIIKLDVEEGRSHLTAKTMHAYKYVYDHHLNDADWFMKADDDTFVIVENLRYFLSDKDPNEPVYHGHHFKPLVKPQGYHSGGAGYVLSREALRRFGSEGYHQPGKCREDGGAEDVSMGWCMQALDVRAADSHDENGASRFHALSVNRFVVGNFPSWYKKYDSYGAKSGVDSLSDYPISFHYIKPNEMYIMAYYAYHMHVFGIGSNNSVNIHNNYLTST